MISHVRGARGRRAGCGAVSTAHGFTEGVGSTVKALEQAFPNLTLIGGNVTNGAGVEFLAKCGADAIKIGRSRINMHYARIVAGVGIPQLTALYVCSKTARELGSER
ncbi:MAG: IMP dehydrogenase [Bacilli bacterium]